MKNVYNFMPSKAALISSCLFTWHFFFLRTCPVIRLLIKPNCIESYGLSL